LATVLIFKNKGQKLGFALAQSFKIVPIPMNVARMKIEFLTCYFFVLGGQLMILFL
jgi:hypothetical protein